jgi:hypothetical protein
LPRKFLEGRFILAPLADSFEHALVANGDRDALKLCPSGTAKKNIRLSLEKTYLPSPKNTVFLDGRPSILLIATKLSGNRIPIQI